MVRKQSHSPTIPLEVTLSGHAVRRGMARLLPICVFVAPFGVGFGIAAVEQGLSPMQAVVMSLVVFTATAQFAALDLLVEPIGYLSLFCIVLALSGRHVIIGAALSKWVNQLPIHTRIATLMFVSDANFADAQPLLHRGETDLGVFLGGGLMLWLTWVFSTALGAFAGDVLGDTDAYGFGAVMLCFFAATAVGMVRKTPRLAIPAVVAMAVSAGSVTLLPMGWNIILAALVGGFLAAATYDK